MTNIDEQVKLFEINLDESTYTVRQLNSKNKYLDRFNNTEEFKGTKELLDLKFSNKKKTYMYKIKCLKCGDVKFSTFDRIMTCPRDSVCYKKKSSTSQKKRFLNESVDTKKLRLQKASTSISKSWNSKSEEEKTGIKNKIKESNLRYWTSESDEHRAARVKNVSEGCRNYWDNLSEEARVAYGKSKSEQFRNYSKDQVIRMRVLQFATRAKLDVEKLDTMFNILYDENLLKEFVSSSINKSIYTLANDLGCTVETLYKYLCKYNLLSVIKHNAVHKGSLFEEDVKASLRLAGYNFEENVKGILKNKRLELDIYFPEFKTAIEVNGGYWHNLNESHTKRDKEKVVMCKEQGIKLITITENDWIDINNQLRTKWMIRLALKRES